MYSGKQEQEPAPDRSVHRAFEPHGDGLQGDTFCTVISIFFKNNIV